MKRILSVLTLCAMAIAAKAQPITEKYARFLTMPNHYVCYRATDPIKVDGKLNESS